MSSDVRSAVMSPQVTNAGRSSTLGSVRIAYVAESFRPDVNGVAITAQRIAEQLTDLGHEPLVIAPDPGPVHRRQGDTGLGYPVVRIPSLALPLYAGLRVGLPMPQLRGAIAAYRSEIVHLAGPVVLGAGGAAAGRGLGL